MSNVVKKDKQTTVSISGLKGLLHRFRGRFFDPRLKNEDARRREYILNIILLISIGILSALDGSILYYSLQLGSRYHDVPFAAFSLLPAFFIFLYYLSRKGHISTASYLLVVTYLVSNSYAAYRYGIALPIGVLTYAVIIFIASILINSRFGFMVTIITSAYIIPLGYLQFQHLVPVQQQAINDSDALIFALFYLLIMSIAWLSNREIERSLFRARTSEQELAKERDMLEIIIKERTRELQETQLESVAQLHRFADLGRLASGLFHDMLNVVNSITIRAEKELPEESDTTLENAFGTTRQMEKFMQAIRKQLSHKESSELFSLADVLDQTIQLASHKATKNGIRIVFSQPSQAISYFGDSFKFRQVFLNLILNAVESYSLKANSNTGISKPRIVSVILKQSMNNAVIEVRDNGIGMDDLIQKKIFEPFFTTKTNENGTGIGLSTAKKIVEENLKGSLTVQSKEGEGSVFTVIFPLSEK